MSVEDGGWEPDWEPDPSGEPDPGGRGYRGRRRATASGGRRRLLLATVVAAAAAVAVAMLVVGPLVLRPPPRGGSTAAPGGTGQSAVPGQTGASQDVQAGPSSAVPPASPGPVPQPSPQPTGGRAPAGSSSTRSRLPSTAPRVTPSARRPAPLAPVTYEAEAPSNTLGGSAHVARYRNASGGRIVRDIGDWGEDDDASGGGAGTLRFNGVAVPAAGVYQLTFFYVNLDNEPTSTAVITTSGGRMITVTVDGGSACCAAKTVQVSLANGANSITFANANGHAPSIDKIIIVGP